jgi:group I intron endonuclease
VCLISGLYLLLAGIYKIKMVIYKIINIVNNKIYIGKDINNNSSYFGSGKLVKRAIKKYGKENFKKEILEHCADLQKLNEQEIYWIKKFNSTDPIIGYNITMGGEGGDTFSNNPNREEIRKKFIGKIVSDETRRKLSEKSKGNKSNLGKTFSDETKQKMKKSQIGKHSGPKHDEEARKKISLAATGRIQSQETRQKRRESMIGKNKGKVLTNDAKEKISKSLKGKETWMKGKHHTEESKQKLREANLGKKQSNETIQKRKDTIKRNKLLKNGNK